VFEAVLEDVSRADAPARVIARMRNGSPGQIPIAFEIRYDPRRVVARRTYVVRASIYERGRLRFTGLQQLPSRPRDRANRIAIMMRGVSGDDGREHGRGEPPATSRSGLENSRWSVIRIGERVVAVSGVQREPWIELDPQSKRVTGSGGCNRISGGYEAGNGTLRFGRTMSTQMACPSMNTETAFLRALAGTRRYRVSGRFLELLDDNGRPLVMLEESNLR
jgi:putative lipoprotein